MAAIIAVDYPILRTLALGTEAHYSQDMAPWRSAPTRRGDGHRLVPQQHGSAARPVYRGPIRFLHEVTVSGRVDPDGAQYPDWIEGLDNNLALLYEACETVTVPPFTFTATHVRPYGNREAEIQVLDIVTPDNFGPGVVTVGLDILIPSGTFDEIPAGS
jgi:hypothetical protein